jgi:transcription elongation GreA/GreB family factor
MNPDVEKLVKGGRLPRKLADNLGNLNPGTFCLHKSWGVGEIKSWDVYADRLMVDFEDKPGHALKFEFAAKSLEPLPDSHILARFKADPESLRSLALEKPAEFMDLVLSSYNNRVSVDQIDDVVSGRFVAKDRYKQWWEATKRQLKKHRRFIVPPKRSLPIELRDEEAAADSLALSFLEANDPRQKRDAIRQLISDLAAFDKTSDDLLPVLENVEEEIGGIARFNLPLAVEILLLRDELVSKAKGLSLPEGMSSVPTILRENRDVIEEIAAGLPLTQLRQVFSSLPEAFGDEWPAVAMGLLPASGLRAISELAKLFEEHGHQETFLAYLRLRMQQRDLSAEMLAWICKERNKAAGPVFGIELGGALLNSMERDHFDEGARRTNRAGELLNSDKGLLPDLVRDATVQQVRSFSRRLLMTPVFDELTRRSLLARIIKTVPEVSDLVSVMEQDARNAASQDRSKPEPAPALIVSWDSLARRQKELEEIVQVKMPANTKEIQIAREYGDLRENFEYKAAKDMQEVLRRQRDDLQAGLERARATDFSEFADTSKVSIGHVVHLRTGDRDFHYIILGAWDTDIDNHIISYLSETAKTLIGHSVGDKITLLGETEGTTREVEILAIEHYSKIPA